MVLCVMHTMSMYCIISSAGVGRTGTFCALHISIERVKAEQLFNLFDTVKHLRTQRAHMVQTLVI